MTSKVYTLRYAGRPAQLVGFYKEGESNVLAVVRLQGEGIYVRLAHPSKLEPVVAIIEDENLRPGAPPRSGD